MLPGALSLAAHIREVNATPASALRILRQRIEKKLTYLVWNPRLMLHEFLMIWQTSQLLTTWDIKVYVPATSEVYSKTSHILNQMLKRRTITQDTFFPVNWPFESDPLGVIWHLQFTPIITIWWTLGWMVKTDIAQEARLVSNLDFQRIWAPPQHMDLILYNNKSSFKSLCTFQIVSVWSYYACYLLQFRNMIKGLPLSPTQRREILLVSNPSWSSLKSLLPSHL